MTVYAAEAMDCSFDLDPLPDGTTVGDEITMTLYIEDAQGTRSFPLTGTVTWIAGSYLHHGHIRGKATAKVNLSWFAR